MNARRLEALRNLAERPGTEAEGQRAREILKRHGYSVEAPRVEKPKTRIVYRGRSWDFPDTWKCDCGREYPINVKCADTERHERIRSKVRERFKRGDRVYYNCWAYSPNCPGTVTGYVTERSGSYARCWGWLNVKFDHLKQSRSVPVVKDGKWILSKEPKAVVKR